MDTKTRFSLTIEENKDVSSVRLTGVVPADEVERHRDTVIAKLKETTTVDGFRPGSVPTDVIEKHVGDLEIWRQCGVAAVTQAFPDIIRESSSLRSVSRTCNLPHCQYEATLPFLLTSSPCRPSPFLNIRRS